MVTADQLVVAYRKWHVPIVERPGWRTRNTGRSWDPIAIIVHHDANNDQVSTARGLAVIEGGRPDLAGPLSNSWNEDDGVVYLTAFGNTNNAGRISAQAYTRIRLRQPPLGDARDLGYVDDGPIGNPLFLAKEVHNAGDGRDPYEPGQMQSLTLQCAAECDLMGWKPDAAIWGHRQVTRRKIDPKGIDLAALAHAVAVCLYVGPGGAKPTLPEDAVFIAHCAERNQNVLSDGVVRQEIIDTDHLTEIEKSGFRTVEISGRWYDRLIDIDLLKK